MAHKIIISVLVLIGIVCWGNAFGNDIFSQQQGDNTASQASGGQDQMRPKPPKGPLEPMVKVMHDTIALQALADITGESTETLEESLQVGQMRTLLESYGIERETFEAAMDAGAVSLAGKLTECGIITQEQADDIIEKIQNRPERPQNTPEMPEEEASL